MSKRQAVIVLEHNSTTPKLRKYGVRYRERGFWPWTWTPWLKASEYASHDHAWDYEYARFLTDQALNNGVVPHHAFKGLCQIIIELDEE